jgi:hypothetical protein
MNECPTCEIELKCYEDFSTLYIHDAKRVKIPKNVKIPFCDADKICIGPNEEPDNTNPPDAVVNYFKKHPRTESYDYKDSVWRLDDAGNSDGYRRFVRLAKDAKNTVINSLNPYFEKLEHLVGKDVTPRDLAPDFANGKIEDAEIPGAEFKLCYSDYSTSDLDEEGTDFEFEKTLLNDNTQRLLEIYVTNKKRANSQNAFYTWQRVAYVIYEGKLLKQG